LSGDPGTGSASLTDRTAGGAIGFDYLANPNLLIGLGVAGSTSSFNVADRATSGTLDGAHLGVYGMQTWGAAYLTGLVSYSRFDNSTTRMIAGVGPTETATGSFASDQLGARLEVGRTWAFDRFRVTPFAAIQVSELWQRGYTETSFTAAGAPGILGLSYQPVTVTSVPTFLGAQVDTRIALANGMAVAPFVRADWVHEFNPTRQITASFLTVPGATFTVDGARAASDSAKVDLGARILVNRNVALLASFNSEFSNAGQIYAGTGALRVNW
jgi:outer membrane autotransporter protein